jgi:hypothetical protein
MEFLDFQQQFSQNSVFTSYAPVPILAIVINPTPQYFSYSRQLPFLFFFLSGYTNNVMVHHDVIETSTNFIQKPFTFDALAHKVRELLNAASD